MALKKQIETESGILAEYWRIHILRHDRKEAKTEVVLGCYKDVTARQADKAPVLSLSLHLIGDIESGNVIQNCYDLIKLLPQFEGAEDV